MYWSPNPPYLRMWPFFWNKDCYGFVANIISESEVIWEQGGPLIQNDWCPSEKRRSHRDMRKKMDAETAVMPWQTKNIKECWQTPEAWRGKQKFSSQWQPRGMGWKGRGREVHKGGDTCLPMADSCWCTAETNTALWSNYPLIKNK